MFLVCTWCKMLPRLSVEGSDEAEEEVGEGAGLPFGRPAEPFGWVSKDGEKDEEKNYWKEFERRSLSPCTNTKCFLILKYE